MGRKGTVKNSMKRFFRYKIDFLLLFFIFYNLNGKRRNMKRNGVQHIQKAPITTPIMAVILKIL